MLYLTTIHNVVNQIITMGLVQLKMENNKHVTCLYDKRALSANIIIGQSMFKRSVLIGQNMFNIELI